MHMLFLPIIIPIAAGLVVLAAPKRLGGVKEALSLLATFITVVVTASLYKSDASCAFPWAGFGISFSLRVYHFSALIIIFAAAFAFLITLYSSVFMRDKKGSKLFYSLLLISTGLVSGAVLSDNLIALLFFWEGLLFTLFGMIAIGSKMAFRTATKAFIIVGIGDLFMMVGIALSFYLAGTLAISEIHIPVSGLGALAFAFLVIGTLAKAGSMPFHSWIPEAAGDAPLPFMALVPASIDKLLGIYFLTRITLDMFRLQPHSWASYTLMTIGAITILFAVMMALVQKDYKKLLSFHAISQLGYMTLGIGTALPVGIVGGIFHMINNALYKNCLFLTAGAVERQAGTTNLEKLGGIGLRMPVTFACFLITALSISGVPPFNGFFSKELIYDGALERGSIFYLAAILGTFLTAASFLKLGHAAFLGKVSDEHKSVREAPVLMLVPMAIIAAVCILFGLRSSIPVNLIMPVLNTREAAYHGASAFPPSHPLMMITLVVLLCALLNHIYGVIRTGSGLKAVDHIHYAPGLGNIYEKAEKGHYDPYNIWTNIVKIFSGLAIRADRAINWIYDGLAVKSSDAIAGFISRRHNGSYRTYIIWSVAATMLVIVLFIMGKP